MKKNIEFRASREIPNDIAFPARTGHDACEPFGSRAAIGCEPFGSRANLRPSVAPELRSGCWRRPEPRRGFESNKYSVELENHRMEMYSGEENCCNIVACTIFSIFFFIFTTLCVEWLRHGDRTTLFVDAVRSTVQI